MEHTSTQINRLALILQARVTHETNNKAIHSERHTTDHVGLLMLLNVCVWFYSEFYLLYNITCIIWTERHLKWKILEDKHKPSNGFNNATQNVYTVVSQQKNLKILMNKGLWIQKCWCLIQFALWFKLTLWFGHTLNYFMWKRTTQ